jgi:hypothetical protein
MVRQTPVTMWRVIAAFALTALVAVLPMTVLMIAQAGTPDTGVPVGPGHAGTALLLGLVVLGAVAALLASLALGVTRRLRPVRAS